jgi:hypothetical protein
MFYIFHEVRPTGERAGRRQITPFIFTFPQPGVYDWAGEIAKCDTALGR